MHLELRTQLTQRLLAAHRLDRDPRFELRTILLSRRRHRPLLCQRLRRNLTLLPGLKSGDHYIPSRNTRSQERRRMQKSRWFRRAQKWRTGCEGRISALKRRHGLRRCLYRGFTGMQRWVGLGVIADNLINIASRLDQTEA